MKQFPCRAGTWSVARRIALGAGLAVLLACGDRESKLVGTWTGGSLISTTTWSFFDDGECLLSPRALGIFDPKPIRCRWEVEGEILRLTKPEGGGTEELRIISLTGSRLKVLLPNGQVEEFEKED